MKPNDLAALPTHVWASPYGTRRDETAGFTPSPGSVVAATLNAWTALVHGGPDQLWPAFTGTGGALILRNLALTLPGKPPIVLYTDDSEITRAYHDVTTPVLGRWATRTPMHFLDETGRPRPLNRRGVSRTSPPRPRVYRAFTPDDLAHWITKLPKACFLFVASTPDAVPENRPPRSHVLLTGALHKIPDSVQRLRLPCLVVPPGPDETDAPPGGGQAGPIRLAVVDSDDYDMARLQELYLRLAREDWGRYAAFLGIARVINQRIQADAFPGTVPVEPDAGAPTDALVRLLDGFVRFGHAPGTADAREFLSVSASVAARSPQRSTPKAAWLETRRAAFEKDGVPAFLVDASYNQARAHRHLKTLNLGGAKPKAYVPGFVRRAEPGPIVVTAAPGAQLLQGLAARAPQESTILLYPWEAGVYASARGRLAVCLDRLGIHSWPTLPAAPRPPAARPETPAQLVPRPRTPLEEVSSEPEEEPADEEVPHDEDVGPTVTVSTTIARNVFPVDRVVLLQRRGVMYELPASAAAPGDVLVAPRGGGHPSAHQVIARICARKPQMNRTRTMATYWRRLLRDHVAAKLLGQNVSAIHAALNPGVSYAQFRHWYIENEPVCPTHENLRRLFHILAQPRQVADLVYAAALDHRSDRRRIYAHLLNLAKNRLDAVYSESTERETSDPDHDVSLEDLQAVIQFEKITGVEPNP